MRTELAVPFVLLALTAACHGPAAAGGDEQQSVKPGINEPFLDPALDVGKYEERFEGESREIFAQRARIAGLLGLRQGMDVADIGAGTGLFTRMFAPKVAPEGTVYAVEIAPKFVDHLRADATRRGHDNVKVVLCDERSTALPAASVDVVFVCDTYHHFEYPQHTLASIRAALRPGGELVVVDFIRIPGVSRDWILDHVRAGQDVVTAEIEAAGFEKVRDEATPYLRENYAMRFRRVGE
ncbi:MAG: class I SAM-dependent methyltransferase [Planctomycetota bacterium]